MISSGVEGRDTRPVYASCRLHSNDATVNEPPEPTPIMLASAVLAMASFNASMSAAHAAA
jgi:hypothetical protein